MSINYFALVWLKCRKLRRKLLLIDAVSLIISYKKFMARWYQNLIQNNTARCKGKEARKRSPAVIFNANVMESTSFVDICKDSNWKITDSDWIENIANYEQTSQICRLIMVYTGLKGNTLVTSRLPVQSNY